MQFLPRELHLSDPPFLVPSSKQLKPLLVSLGVTAPSAHANCGPGNLVSKRGDFLAGINNGGKAIVGTKPQSWVRDPFRPDSGKGEIL